MIMSTTENTSTKPTKKWTAIIVAITAIGTFIFCESGILNV